MTHLEFNLLLIEQFQRLLLTQTSEINTLDLETSRETNDDGEATYRVNIHTPQGLILCEINDFVQVLIVNTQDSNDHEKIIDSFKKPTPSHAIEAKALVQFITDMAEKALHQFNHYSIEELVK